MKIEVSIGEIVNGYIDYSNLQAQMFNAADRYVNSCLCIVVCFVLLVLLGAVVLDRSLFCPILEEV